MKELSLLTSSKDCSIYQIRPLSSDTDVFSYMASTPETRTIVNDPLVAGIAYTTTLQKACTEILKKLPDILPSHVTKTLREENTSVLNILRGGLNFGLREALGTAYSWNDHSAAFISAQRVRDSKNSEEWHITESNYQKIYLSDKPTIVFGDVVATGTSLEFALNELLRISEATLHPITTLVFFTFGGSRSTEILSSISKKAKKIFPGYVGSVVIYLEGCFSVATQESPLSIKLTGTDLLRRDSLLTPELIQSQLENPAFPIERCIIYDAGSRAFWLKEYYNDILEYWESTKKLAENGMTYDELISERFPEIKDILRTNIDFELEDINLKKLCDTQISKLNKKLMCSG